jgi:glycosyltransferase involved in cell wall biosynthesis
MVQDGGSGDGSVDLLGRYAHELSGWATEPDSGQADAINRAFAQTSGEIMGWLNSDDLLLPGALAYVARYFVEHPDVDVVYGDRLMIDADDGEIGAWILPRHDDRVLTYADYVPQETLFWRRRIWEATGEALDTQFAYALDWDLLLRFQAAGARMAHLPRFLGAFRVHDEQKTSADLVVGLHEMNLLRERVHGRPVPMDEVLRMLTSYFVRHRIRHAWHRLQDRLPIRQFVVESPIELYARRARVALPAAETLALETREPAGAKRLADSRET